MAKKILFLVSFGTLGILVYIAAEWSFGGRTLAELSNTLKTIHGVQITKIQRSYFVAGEVDSMRDLTFVNKVIDSLNRRNPSASTGNQFNSLVHLNSLAKKRIAVEIESEINLKTVHARFFKNNVLLEGIANNDFEADRAVAMATAVLSEGMDAQPNSARLPAASGNQEVSRTQFSLSVPVLLDLIRVRPRR